MAIGLSALLQRQSRPQRRLPWTHHGPHVQAFLGNVLNPKAAGVYLTLLPQFLDPGLPVVPQIYALATVHVAVALIYLVLLSHVVSAAGVVLDEPAWRTWMQRVTGIVLVFFGLRTATAAG